MSILNIITDVTHYTCIYFNTDIYTTQKTTITDTHTLWNKRASFVIHIVAIKWEEWGVYCEQVKMFLWLQTTQTQMKTPTLHSDTAITKSVPTQSVRFCAWIAQRFQPWKHWGIQSEQSYTPSMQWGKWGLMERAHFLLSQVKGYTKEWKSAGGTWLNQENEWQMKYVENLTTDRGSRLWSWANEGGLGSGAKRPIGWEEEQHNKRIQCIMG